jgi:hypothetical protein
MFFRPRTYLAVFLLALLSAEPAAGQPFRRQQRLGRLQQQNALLQQQIAVQTAVQQTTAVVQSANLTSPEAKSPYRINLQQQETALQIAIQETTALLQASYRQNNALSQLALRQLNTLQGALQQTISLQGALQQTTSSQESPPSQGGMLTPYQLQLLSQEQTSLMGLLTSQPPPTPGRTSRR